MAGRGRKSCDEGLAIAFAAGADAASAARHARCSERTARRRWAEENFRRKVEEMRAEMVGKAVGRLSSVGVLAVDTLHNLLTDRSSTVKLGAARAVLEYMLRGHDEIGVLKQIEALRRELAEMRGDGDGGGET
jgi:hypothetical protein